MNYPLPTEFLKGRGIKNCSGPDGLRAAFTQKKSVPINNTIAGRFTGTARRRFYDDLSEQTLDKVNEHLEELDGSSEPACGVVVAEHTLDFISAAFDVSQVINLEALGAVL